MWRRLKNTGWFFLFLVMGLLVSADFGEELEPRPERMEKVFQKIQSTTRSVTTFFHVLTHHPDEFFELVAAFNLVKDEYVDSVNNTALLAGAMSGMMGSLEPHSYYLDHRDSKRLTKNAPSSSISAGIRVASIEDGWLRIGEVIENSPARRAGLQTNDLITHIGGVSVRWQTFNNVIQQIRSSPKTGIHLTVFRKKEQRSFTVFVVRENITWPQVRTKWIAPGFAWVHISDFDYGVTKDFAHKVHALCQENPQLKGLVLDLRDNPGGFLYYTTVISSAFLPPNQVILTTKGRSLDSNRSLKTFSQKFPPILQTVPMVVLVNEGSASASEVVAGALQDYKRAILMGSPSFGKGVIQTFYISSDSRMGFQFTIERGYLPSGRSIQAKGLIPDVLVNAKSGGSLSPILQLYEAELRNHLTNDQDVNPKDPAIEEARKKARQQARANALAELEEEERKPLIKRKLFNPPLGSPEDFQLTQALNHLKGLPVQQAETPRP